MNWRSELYSADQSQTLIFLEVEFNRLDQMVEIDLNVNEYIQDLNSTRDINRNFIYIITNLI